MSIQMTHWKIWILPENILHLSNLHLPASHFISGKLRAKIRVRYALTETNVSTDNQIVRFVLAWHTPYDELFIVKSLISNMSVACHFVVVIYIETINCVDNKSCISFQATFNHIGVILHTESNGGRKHSYFRMDGNASKIVTTYSLFHTSALPCRQYLFGMRDSLVRVYCEFSKRRSLIRYIFIYFYQWEATAAQINLVYWSTNSAFGLQK